MKILLLFISIFIVMCNAPYAQFRGSGWQTWDIPIIQWREIFVTPSAVKVNPVNTKPDYVMWVFPGQTYSFDADAAESLYFHEEIPHDWKIGTALQPNLHWAPSTTNAGNCTWKIAWMVKDINAVFSFTASDTLSFVDAGDGTANKQQFFEFGEVSMAGVTDVSAVISGVLIRDAAQGSDTFTGEAIFLDLGFHYQIDALGSKWKTAK
jgi:hypothetical protein